MKGKISLFGSPDSRGKLTDHGRPDTHKVPHTHIIEIGEIIDRKKGAKSYAH